jgi:hypothetical protein
MVFIFSYNISFLNYLLSDWQSPLNEEL